MHPDLLGECKIKCAPNHWLDARSWLSCLPPYVSLKTLKPGRGSPRSDLVEHTFLLLLVAALYKVVVHPLQQSVTLAQVVLFFVAAIIVIEIAVVTIRYNQRRNVFREIPPE
jgi:hypothetical protein